MELTVEDEDGAGVGGAVKTASCITAPACLPNLICVCCTLNVRSIPIWPFCLLATF